VAKVAVVVAVVRKVAEVVDLAETISRNRLLCSETGMPLPVKYGLRHFFFKFMKNLTGFELNRNY
jgi:hypothetical protein